MKQRDTKILNKRKENLAKRFERKQYPEQPKPLLRAQNIHYEMAERVCAIECGGIGAFHLLACNSGLVDVINERVNLLKRHLPYHESDHVLNIAYNTLTGGTCLDDIKLRRNDEAFMDGLGVVLPVELPHRPAAAQGFGLIESPGIFVLHRKQPDVGRPGKRKA